MIDFNAVLAANSHRFREVLAGVLRQSGCRRCPDWAADDLLWHLTEVQSFWLTIVDQGLQTDEQVGAVTAPGRPVDRDAAIALFERVSFHLAMKLDVTGDDVPAWTWTPNHTVGWVRRRQAQEALMHRVDAEQPGRVPSEIDPDSPRTGSTSCSRQFGSEPPAWAFDPCGMLVEVRSAPTGRAWHVTLGRFRGVDPSGQGHDEPDYQPMSGPGGPADAVLEGAPGDLLLWLWGRADGAGISATGDQAARAALREAIVANTQ